MSAKPQHHGASSPIFASDRECDVVHEDNDAPQMLNADNISNEPLGEHNMSSSGTCLNNGGETLSSLDQQQDTGLPLEDSCASDRDDLFLQSIRQTFSADGAPNLEPKRDTAANKRTHMVKQKTASRPQALPT